MTENPRYNRKYQERIFEPYEEEYGIKGKMRNSEDYFRAAVNITLEKYGLASFVIASEFEVSESTCDRWGRGRSIPVESVREVVLDRLADLIVDSLGKK